MLSGAVDVKVNFADQGVIAAMDGGVEAVATEVESTIFAVRGTVAARILLENAQDA